MYVLNLGTIISFTLGIVTYFIGDKGASPGESGAGGPLNPGVRPREEVGSLQSAKPWGTP